MLSDVLLWVSCKIVWECGAPKSVGAAVRANSLNAPKSGHECQSVSGSFVLDLAPWLCFLTRSILYAVLLCATLCYSHLMTRQCSQYCHRRDSHHAIITVVHLVQLMNADSAPGGRQP